MKKNNAPNRPNENPSVLSRVLDAKRQVPDDYKVLIEEERQHYIAQGIYHPDAEFSQQWRGLDSRQPFRKILKQCLAGQTLVGLGGGEGYTSISMADNAGAASYINVDMKQGTRRISYEGKDINPLVALKEQTLGDLIVIDVRADMLDFISRMRSNIANFVVDGIDNYVIEDPHYHKAVAKEIARVTMPGGLVFGCGSEWIGGALLSRKSRNPTLGLNKKERIELRDFGLGTLGLINTPSSINPAKNDSSDLRGSFLLRKRK